MGCTPVDANQRRARTVGILSALAIQHSRRQGCAAGGRWRRRVTAVCRSEGEAGEGKQIGRSSLIGEGWLRRQQATYARIGTLDEHAHRRKSNASVSTQEEPCMRHNCSSARSCEAELLLDQVKLSQGYNFCSTACAGEQNGSLL